MSTVKNDKKSSKPENHQNQENAKNTKSDKIMKMKNDQKWQNAKVENRKSVSKFSVWPPPCRFRPKNRVPWYPQGLKKCRTRRLGFRKVSILAIYLTFWPFWGGVIFWHFFDHIFTFLILSLFVFLHFDHFLYFCIFMILSLFHFCLILCVRPYCNVIRHIFRFIGENENYVWWLSPHFLCFRFIVFYEVFCFRCRGDYTG